MLTEVIARLKDRENRPRFSEHDYLYGINELNQCSDVLYLVLYDYEHEDYAEKDEVRKLIRLSLAPILYQGHEPTFNNSHNWGYPVLCQTFALIKNKDDLWNLFNEDSQARITVLMKMFGLMWNFGCNAFNNYTTGIGLHGNYTKHSGPNYRLSNNLLLPYVVSFFGGLKYVNDIFKFTTYDENIAELRKYNFMNAYHTWTTPGIDLPDGTCSPGARELYSTLEKRQLTGDASRTSAYINDNGNIKFAGRGQGCTLIYYYLPRGVTWASKENMLSYPDGLIQDVLLDTFSGGAVVSSIYIEDEDAYCKMENNAVSPYETLDGMMKEFNIPDDGLGQRSSIEHCMIDFVLVTTSLCALKYLNIVDIYNLPYWDKIKVGMNDFLYKYHNGYNGYSMGQWEKVLPKLNLGLWENYWLSNLDR